jgi:WD40 repeat protein
MVIAVGATAVAQSIGGGKVGPTATPPGPGRTGSDTPASPTPSLSGTGHRSAVTSVAFSPDGRTLASGSVDTTVLLWDVATGRQRGGPMSHWAKVTDVAFSTDGRLLATTTEDATGARLWDVGRQTQMRGDFVGGDVIGVARKVAVSPDGEALATIGSGAVRFWDISSGRPTGDPIISHGFCAGWTAAISPRWDVLAVACQNNIELWDISGRRRVGTVQGSVGNVILAFSPDGTILAGTSDLDSAVRLWDVKAHELIGQLGQPGLILGVGLDLVQCMEFSPDGKTLATGSNDTMVRLWNVARREQIGKPVSGHTKAILGVAFSPDGRTLATGGEDGIVQLWDVTAMAQPTRSHTLCP